VRSEWADLPVLMVAAQGSLSSAVEAMKRGATDFIPKPFERNAMLLAIRKALSLRSSPKLRPAAEPIDLTLPISTPMQQALEVVARAAPTLATVLLRGETGTGKSRLAQEIHRQSGRPGAFVTVFCGAIPEPLMESELFGHEKGAFTGAVNRKLGRVELANGGTLFFDEIGELSAAMQIKLLRLFQDREFERVGGTETLHADVRFVVATHRDLDAAVADGTFREDLYYRLNVVPIEVPALRSRPVDIRQLSLQFIEDLSRVHNRSVRLSEGALAVIQANPWPGNVRQLQNFLERVVVLHAGPSVSAADIERLLPVLALAPRQAQLQAQAPEEPKRRGTARVIDRAAILDALRRADNNRTRAAELLGVSRRTFYNKLQEHGLATEP
jgi:two-component system response regulator AtoC